VASFEIQAMWLIPSSSTAVLLRGRACPKRARAVVIRPRLSAVIAISPIVAAPASAIPLDALQLTARVQLSKRPHARANMPLDGLIDRSTSRPAPTSPCTPRTASWAWVRSPIKTRSIPTWSTPGQADRVSAAGSVLLRLGDQLRDDPRRPLRRRRAGRHRSSSSPGFSARDVDSSSVSDPITSSSGWCVSSSRAMRCTYVMR